MIEILALGMFFFGVGACVYMFISVKRVAQIQAEIECLIEEKDNGEEIQASISEAEPSLQMSTLWQGAPSSKEGRKANGLL